MVRVRSHQRNIEYSVDSQKALELRLYGLSLSEIRDRLSPSASIPTISRAIRRGLAERQARARAYTQVPATQADW